MPAIETFARRFYADQLDFFVRHECVEDAHGVRSPADAGDDGFRQTFRAREHLSPGLTANHRLEIAHHARVRSRADH
jgi:hypothetical protein